jgi:hypothetical protein
VTGIGTETETGTETGTEIEIGTEIVIVIDFGTLLLVSTTDLAAAVVVVVVVGTEIGIGGVAIETIAEDTTVAAAAAAAAAVPTAAVVVAVADVRRLIHRRCPNKSSRCIPCKLGDLVTCDCTLVRRGPRC